MRLVKCSSWRVVPAAVILAVASSGCVSSWWNSFLDPTQLGNFRESVVNEIQQTISFRDTPSGIPNAVDPTPEDLVQTVEEYQIGVGDMLSIRILDFLSRDTESEFQPVVDELGYIHLPPLGYIHVDGMTARELRSEIIQRSKNAGIFRADAEPTVVIAFLQQQQRVYHVGGVIASPGRYRIIPPDFRLREAINQGGGLDPSVKTIYVMRNEPKPRVVRDRGVRPGVPAAPAGSDAPPAPPVSPVSMSEMAGGPNPTLAAPPAPNRSLAPPAADPLAVPGEQQPDRELLDALTPEPAPSGPSAPTTVEPSAALPPAPGSTEAPSTAPTLPPFIYVNDKFIEGTAPTPAPAPEAGREPGAAPAPPAQSEASPAVPPAAAAPTPSEAVDWQELAPDSQQRILRIPADKLLRGDSNYNIVIHSDDFIRLDSGHVGVFYLMGHVVRPGVYSLTGQEITLRQAIAAAGGLDALAWPTRCEITRRLDGDREEITQWDLARIIEGKDPDLYLKPEDVVNVGTHAIAPLLATIRNSFRLTYGFGFVYDRNFGDIDSVQPQNNPRDRRRIELQQRFPGLFP